jgi:hypothetical protein
MAPWEAPSSTSPGGAARRPGSDTSPEVEEILYERLRRMTPSQRFVQEVELCKVERQFMRAGIRMRHPDYDADQVEMALARLLWGDELYRKARPQWPLLEP